MKYNYFSKLAEKYRPKLLKNIIGQYRAVQLLQKFIKSNNFPPCIVNGIRGIGKTTIARVAARFLNCVNRGNDLCLKCANCVNNNNIIEIDAASNNSVTDIRDIVQKCNYRPYDSYYRIFIIDEFHMFSHSAFSSLLKILEECYRYNIFIMITTEIKKIPNTIISRCRKITLFRVNNLTILNYIVMIAKKEKIFIEKNAAIILSIYSEGSIRDALSLIDQLIVSKNSDSINIQDIIDVLGIINPYIICDIIIHIIHGNIKEIILLIRNLYNYGISITVIFKQINDMLYKIICYKVGIFKYSNFITNDFYTFIDNVSIICIIKIWDLVNNNALQNNLYDELSIIEMFFIKLVYLNFFLDPNSILTLS